MEQQSSSYKVMSKRSGKYNRTGNAVKKLNISAPPITVKSKNNMKKKVSKSFAGKATKRQMTSKPVGPTKRAVSMSTKGMVGSGKSFKKGPMGDTKRVTQISPVQRSGMSKKMSMTVAETPIRQNKKPVSNGKSLAMYKKSLRKTMGYGA